MKKPASKVHILFHKKWVPVQLLYSVFGFIPRGTTTKFDKEIKRAIEGHLKKKAFLLRPSNLDMTAVSLVLPIVVPRKSTRKYAIN